MEEWRGVEYDSGERQWGDDVMKILGVGVDFQGSKGCDGVENEGWIMDSSVEGKGRDEGII